MRSNKIVFLVLVLGLAAACDKDKDKDKKSGATYAFTAAASTSIKASGFNLADEIDGTDLLDAGGAANLCATGQTITCVAPTGLTGKYFSVGLLIQANGQGMQSYLLGDSWNDIKGTSTTYDFDASAPTVSSGNLACCGGSGDLTGDNVYFSNAAYLFAYLDASFKVPYSALQKTRVTPEMLAAHTVRFVFADDVVSGYKRGDLLYKDTDSTFKWVDDSGNLSATRPSSPITLDTKVVSYTSPFEGLTSPIPVIYTDINDGVNGKVTTSEDALKATGKTYTFDFNTSSLIVFMLKSDELEIMGTKKDLLQRIHLSGLPHTKFTFGTAGSSSLTIQ